MQKDNLTQSFCLRELANNLEREDRLYIRIGPVLLDWEYSEENEQILYCVHDKNGKKECFVDLIEAINHFISTVIYL